MLFLSSRCPFYSTRLCGRSVWQHFAIEVPIRVYLTLLIIFYTNLIKFESFSVLRFLDGMGDGRCSTQGSFSPAPPPHPFCCKIGQNLNICPFWPIFTHLPIFYSCLFRGGGGGEQIIRPCPLYWIKAYLPVAEIPPPGHMPPLFNTRV